MNQIKALPFPSLLQTLVPGQSLLRSLSLVTLGCLLVALTAQFSIGGPVPITGQTFGVLLVGAALGSRLGFWTLVAYMAAGGLGAPFFAGGTGGFGRGLTLGYLIAFPIAAWMVGYLVERFGTDRSPWKTLLMMLAASLLIYAIGVPVLGWVGFELGLFSDWGQVLVAGMTKFLVGDLLKAMLAAAVLPLAWRLLR